MHEHSDSLTPSDRTQPTHLVEPIREGEQDVQGPGGVRQRVGLVLGLVTFGVMLALPVPEGLMLPAWRTAAVGVLMALWWMTEAIPIPATGLVPLVLFPLLGVAGMQGTAAPYAHPLIFLFMGGFILAQAMQRWNLHKRIALTIIHHIGSNPKSIIAGFMLAAALLSMWVSNTATALMMLPIGASVIALTDDSGDTRAVTPVFGIILMLGIAYGSSIGGMGTIIGTPPNAFMVGFMASAYGVEIGFGRWMLVGVPFMVVGLALTFVLLTRVAFPLRLTELPGGAALISRTRLAMGRITRPERRVAVVFGVVVASWIFRPLIADVLPGLTDTGVAMMGALVMFVLPSGDPGQRYLLSWSQAEKLPWGVLILFGGGLSLADAINTTGLAEWIGQGLEGFGAWPVLALIGLIALVIILLTELTSNIATTAAFLPIVAAVAVGLGYDPMLLVVPTAMAASCAFMLPVATPPNAIVYGSGAFTIPQMAHAGVWLNFAFMALITLMSYFWVPLVFGIEMP